MTAEQAIRTWMLSRPDVTAILGDGTTNSPFRWYGLTLPQATDTYPAVAAETTGVLRDDALTQDGPGNHCERTVEWRVWAKRYDDAIDAADVIRKELRYIQRQIGTGRPFSIAGLRILLLKLESEADAYEPPEDKGKTGFYARVMSIEIHHEEGD